MASLVIVALPAEDDYVNKISSQQAAHMTLLFLGDDASKVQHLDLIKSFVEHAANEMLTRFGMVVDYRGELGQDKADVIFFRKDGYCFDDVNNFRSALLQDHNIRLAFDIAEQHEEWLPHLTLGYPDSPAKPDDRDYPGIYSVNFDRIAVWDQEFSGMEFRLEQENYMLMGERTVGEILEHHGIKGMKWGHRKITDSGGQTTRLSPSVTSYRPGNIRSTRRARRLSGGTYGFNAPNMMRMSRVHQQALPGIQKDLAKINRDPNTVKGNASVTRSFFEGSLQRNHPARVKYDSQVESIVRKNYQSTITKTYGKKYSDLDFKVIRVDNKIVNGSRFAVKVTPKVKHDSLNEDPTTLEFEVKYIRDKNGFVTGVELVDDSSEVAQSADEIIENILIHQGTVKV